MVLRNCSACKQDLPLMSFYRNTKGKYGKSNKCRECTKMHSKEDRVKNAARIGAQKYNSTIEEINEVLSKINCEICGASPKPEKRNFIDHCHTTGKVRGLLCDDCNMGIGRFKDNPDLLKKAIEYLNEHSK